MVSYIGGSGINSLQVDQRGIISNMYFDQEFHLKFPHSMISFVKVTWRLVLYVTGFRLKSVCNARQKFSRTSVSNLANLYIVSPTFAVHLDPPCSEIILII